MEERNYSALPPSLLPSFSSLSSGRAYIAGCAAGGGRGIAGGRIKRSGEKSGRRREREREMDARTRPLGSRASTSLSLLFSPSPCSLPALPPVSHPPFARCGILFAFVLAIFLAYDRRVFSHVTRLFGSFFLITCSLGSTLIANGSSKQTSSS